MAMLHDKVIVITGGASGIGRASVRRALDEGASVMAVDRDAEGLETLRAEAAGNLLTAVGDVTDEEFITATLQNVTDRFGGLHGLATIAGISESGKALTDIEPDSWDRVFAVNVKATWRWMSLAVPIMRQSITATGDASIVTLTSQLAFAGGRMNAAYIASKGAVVSLSKTAAFELAPDHIRVNAVAPGATETPLLDSGLGRQADPEGAREYSRRRHAMGRFGKPEEIANGIIWLLSEQARFTTGTTLVIDGGWLAA